MPISMDILLEILHYYYFNMKGRLFFYYLWGFIANFLLQEIRVFLEVKFPVPTAEGLIYFLQCILETSLASNQTIRINIYKNVLYYPPDQWKTFFNRLGISSFDEKTFKTLHICILSSAFTTKSFVIHTTPIIKEVSARTSSPHCSCQRNTNTTTEL